MLQELLVSMLPGFYEEGYHYFLIEWFQAKKLDSECLRTKIHAPSLDDEVFLDHIIEMNYHHHQLSYPTK